MIKKVITYTDFNGEEHTDELYFHLSKNDLIALRTAEEGRYVERLENLAAKAQKVAESNDEKKIVSMLGGVIDVVKEIIHMAYGKKSEDGKRFIKDEQATLEFEQSIAYDEFLYSLFVNEEEATKFVKALVGTDA